MTHVSVAVIGAGPTGMTVATLLAQYGIETLVLERWPDVYPQPRAVHLDDEVYRIVDRLGVAGEFAKVSRPALGLQLVDEQLNVMARFHRGPGRCGFPQANMFDQPELETLLRDNASRYPQIDLRAGVEVTGVEPGRITLADGAVIECDYILGCDGANSLVRRSIGVAMKDLGFDQRWLVVDIATTADLRQWDGVYQVCSTRRAATYMRIGDAATAGNSSCCQANPPRTTALWRHCARCWHPGPRNPTWSWSGSPSTPSAPCSRSGGGTATRSCSATPHISPRRSSARAWAPGCAMR